MRVGATLVRDSVPSEEAKETAWKLKGLLKSIQSKTNERDDLTSTGEEHEGRKVRPKKRKIIEEPER